MKSIFKPSIVAAALLVSSITYAQTTVTTTTSAEGTITEYSPQSLIISSAAGAPPIRYSYNETTSYVDELGNPVSASVVRSGLPVTVYYNQTGDALVANRVVVRRGGQAVTTAVAPSTVATTTTETTATGYINEFGPGAIVVRSDGGSAPLRYRASDTTTYVDEFGSPVSVETVRAGAPVTVHYTRVGNEMTASRVIVRKAAVVAPAPAAVVPAPAPTAIERRTTTTIRSSEDDDDEE